MANSVTSTAKKAKYTKKTGATAYQVYHLETDTNQVLIDEPLATGESFGGGTIDKGTSLHEVLEEIINVADTGGQASEGLTTHKQDYNNPHKVTADQVGLGNVKNVGLDGSPVSGSTNYVTSGGVYNSVDAVKKIANSAQSKADAAYDLANGRSKAIVFGSVSQLISGTGVPTNYNVGDSVFITAAGVSDFWIAKIATQKVTGWENSTESEIEIAKDGEKIYATWGSKYITLVAVETKTDLAPYIKANDVEAIYVKKDDAVGITGDVTGFGSFNSGIGVSLSESGVKAGTYSAITVDSKGRATAGYQMVIFATSANDPNLSNLAVGGIAVIENS